MTRNSFARLARRTEGPAKPRSRSAISTHVRRSLRGSLKILFLAMIVLAQLCPVILIMWTTTTNRLDVFNMVHAILSWISLPWLWISTHLVTLPGLVVLAASFLTVSLLLVPVPLAFPGPWSQVSKTSIAQTAFRQTIKGALATLDPSTRTLEMGNLSNMYYGSVWRFPLTFPSILFSIFTSAAALGFVIPPLFLFHGTPVVITHILSEGSIATGFQNTFSLLLNPFVFITIASQQILWPMGLFFWSNITLQVCISLVINLIWSEYQFHRQQALVAPAITASQFELCEMMGYTQPAATRR